MKKKEEEITEEKEGNRTEHSPGWAGHALAPGLSPSLSGRLPGWPPGPQALPPRAPAPGSLRWQLSH